MKITRMALMVWMAGAVAHGGETQQKLTVCLRLRTTDPHTLTPLAQELAAKMFANIGISLEWKTWEPACESSPPPIIIDVVSETPADLMPGGLAYALPYEGSHIKVFFDRIMRTEYPAFVFAQVMVHEITHIVQGVCRHSDTGLMKARWNMHDRSEMRLRPLPFTREDLELIYQGLSSRWGGRLHWMWRDERLV
jgi:hypothetical protein